jgi:chemotaxis signal transduction protein
MSLENSALASSFVVFQARNRRVAFPRERVGELIASPVLYSFPHTTPRLAGVVLRRGRILPVLQLAPEVDDTPASSARFFLVVERRISDLPERCAIPIQGVCELVSGSMIPVTEQDSVAIGYLDHDGEQIEILDLEKAIAAGGIQDEAADAVAEELS